MPFKSIALNEFDLPIVIEKDSQYLDALTRILNKYTIQLNSTNNLPNDILVNTKRNINLIIESINHYYKANIYDASHKISTILYHYQSSPFFVSNASASYAFKGIKTSNITPHLYRARKGNVEFQLNDFLHIPLDERGKISTQRFSIPGIPCIYLGTTSYVCWVELDKPLDNELNVSFFNIPDIKVLNLCLTQHLINGHSTTVESSDPNNTETQKLFDMIELWPLVCATSFRVKDTARVFKSEYIVSNLIMQNLTKFQIDSVAYISKKIKNDSDSFPQAVNLAIPIKTPSNKQRYGDICKQLLLTPPTNFGEFIKAEHSLRSPYTSLVNSFEGYSSLVEFANHNLPYQKLPFSKFDNYLLSLKMFQPKF